MSWKRLDGKESDMRPRVWEKNDIRVKVERFEKTGTWDTWKDDELQANFDNKEKAINRAEKFIGS